jgi:hypothetical protein
VSPLQIHTPFQSSFRSVTYNATIPTEVADRSSQTQPFAILDLLSLAGLGKTIRANPARFDALENAGFKLDRYGSITDCLYNRGGGHYVDVGASEKISHGLVCFTPQNLTWKLIFAGQDEKQCSSYSLYFRWT